MTETELSALEARIKKGQKTFIEVGLALMEIQDSKAYKTLRRFKTFEAYVQGIFGFTRQRAYQLIQSAELAVEFKKLTGRELANSKEAEELGKQLRERPPEVVKTLLSSYTAGDLKRARTIENSGKTARKEIHKQTKTANVKAMIAKAKTILSSPRAPYRVERKDFRNFLLTLEPHSVDLILSDIDYHTNMAHLAKPLSKLAKRVLKKDTGILAVMIGHLTIDHFFAGLCKHVPYRGMICYQMPGGRGPILHIEHWNPYWKPVIVLGASADYIHYDIVVAGNCDKEFIDEQQDLVGFKKLIELLIRPGAVNGVPSPGKTILDVNCGSGTTLIAGLLASSGPHNVIGCDLDEVRVELSKSRCKVAWDFLKQNKGDGEKALKALKDYEKQLAEAELKQVA